MPTKAAVRDIFPPNRVTCARRYSRSKTSRASRNGKVIISLPFSHLTTVGASDVISFGSISARIGSRAFARRHNQEPIDHVAQLTYVTGPGIGLQGGHRVFAEIARGEPRRVG